MTHLVQFLESEFNSLFSEASSADIKAVFSDQSLSCTALSACSWSLTVVSWVLVVDCVTSHVFLYVLFLSVSFSFFWGNYQRFWDPWFFLGLCYLRFVLFDLGEMFFEKERRVGWKKRKGFIVHFSCVFYHFCFFVILNLI